jgi:hypothetical protein
MMTQEESYSVLVRAFSILDQQQVENFAWHLRRETPILCAARAENYIDGAGGG